MILLNNVKGHEKYNYEQTAEISEQKLNDNLFCRYFEFQ